MEMLNRAIEDAADFVWMLDKIVTRREAKAIAAATRPVDPECAAWNAEVDRKSAEKKARKSQHTMALDALRK